MATAQHGSAPADEAVGVLVLRVWREAGGASGFRARIIASTANNSEDTLAVVADVDKALDVVRSWLLAQDG